MIKLLVVLTILVVLLLGLVAGYWARRLEKEMNELLGWLHEQPPPEPTITRGNPLFSNESQPGNVESRIVEPKSPQLIDWEEQQELERMNKTVKVKPR